MKEETDSILRALGDVLLQLGCDTGWLVPNTALSTRQLNASIAQYQALLDKMELEVVAATACARQRSAQPAAVEPVPEEPAETQPEPAALAEPAEPADLPDKFVDLSTGLGDDLDFYDMNRDGLGMFDDVGLGGGPSTGLDAGKLDSYGMIDDYF